MKSPTFRDLEQLSAYLDGQLSPSMRTRLEAQIKSDPELAAALEELRQTRLLLRRTPRRRAPRNFTLTPRMAGLRAPLPRLVPVFSWASAVAMLLFIFTLGTSLVGGLSLGAAAPAQAPAPFAFNAASAPATAAPATLAPLAVAPATAAPATQLPATDQAVLATATAEAFVMAAPEATPPALNRLAGSQVAQKAAPKPLSLWLFIWPGLAVLLGALAILVRWANQRAFHRKNPPG